jgi:hypothetical protein
MILPCPDELLIVDLHGRKGEQLPWIVSDGLWERIEP